MRSCVQTIVFCALSLIAAVTSGQTLPWEGAYQYDGAGNTKAIGGNHYVYDDVSRLRQSTAITGAQQLVQRYRYDAFGNLLDTTTGDAVLAMAVDSRTGHIDHISGCPANSTCYAGTFDEAGNQISFGSTSYGYDVASALTELQSVNRHQLYLYDADGERIATVDYNGAGSQTWHYTPRDLAARVTREVDDTVNGSAHSFSWRKDYVYRAANLLSSVTPSTAGESKTHFHLDYLGSPRLITDAASRMTAVHTYWAFGGEAGGSDVDTESMKFTGHERDATGDGNDLDYMHARYYSSNGGRFLSIDPKDGRPAEPQSWNRYAYVLDNPLSKIDLTGRGDDTPGVRDVLIFQVKVGFRAGVEAGPVRVGFAREVRVDPMKGAAELRTMYSAKAAGYGVEGGVKFPLWTASGGAMPTPPEGRSAVSLDVGEGGVKADNNGNLTATIPVVGPVSAVIGVNVPNLLAATLKKPLESLSEFAKTASQFFTPPPPQKEEEGDSKPMTNQLEFEKPRQ